MLEQYRILKHVVYVAHAWYAPLREVMVEWCRTPKLTLHILHSWHVPLRDLTDRWCRTTEHAVHFRNDRHIPIRNAITIQNILAMTATLDTSHFESLPLNIFARRNCLCVFSMCDTCQLESSSLKTSTLWNMAVMSWALDTSIILNQRYCIPESLVYLSCMFVTLDTSHIEISELNSVAPKNMARMSFALDTSPLEILL